MNRTPPVEIRRQLAEEVGFACPVDGCGSPYLTWHHFDPPWATEQHHRSDGMVALCMDHHAQADTGAFTTSQLRKFKDSGRGPRRILGARFNWMRRNLLAVVGGNFFYEVPIPVRIDDTPVVALRRNQMGQVLVNLSMPTVSGKPRMVMIDNFWLTEGVDEQEIICPPSGRLVCAKYPNGDSLKVEFREFATREDFEKRHGHVPKVGADFSGASDIFREHLSNLGIFNMFGSPFEMLGIKFPLTTVEISMVIADSSVSFPAKETSTPGTILRGSWSGYSEVGLQIDTPRQAGVESAP